MLEVVLYLILIALFALVVFYIYIETQRKKIIAENKKAISLRVNKVKDNFKTDLKIRVEHEVLSVAQHGIVYQICNNFFVFQKITPNSINYCEQLLKKVITAIPLLDNEDNAEQLQQPISVFVSSLPKTANGYNVNFYQNELPKLINHLIDSQDNFYNIEDEISVNNTNITAA